VDRAPVWPDPAKQVLDPPIFTYAELPGDPPNGFLGSEIVGPTQELSYKVSHRLTSTPSTDLPLPAEAGKD